MRSSLPWIAASIATGVLAIGCSAAPSPLPSGAPALTTSPGPAVPAPSPTITSEPSGSSTALIEHATGSTDVILRFDNGLGDFGICELCGGWGAFEPGPEFTLFGDGTVIFRAIGPQPATDAGPIVGAEPFEVAELDEEQIQALLRFAIDGGGLGSASAQYDAAVDTDDPSYSMITVRAGGLDKRIQVHGVSPFAALLEQLRQYADRLDIPTSAWAPSRSWGLLIEMSSWIEVGVLPAPPTPMVVAWPWPSLDPWVTGTATNPGSEDPRRVMSSEEAAALGLLDDGIVVRQVFVRGPDRETIYSFSLWPTFPDDPG